MAEESVVSLEEEVVEFLMSWGSSSVDVKDDASGNSGWTPLRPTTKLHFLRPPQRSALGIPRRIHALSAFRRKLHLPLRRPFVRGYESVPLLLGYTLIVEESKVSLSRPQISLKRLRTWLS